MSKYDEHVEAMKAHLKAARDIADAVDQAGREFTEDEQARVRELLGKASEAKAAAEKAKSEVEVRKAIAELGEGIGVEEKSAETKARSGLVVPTAGKSLGQAYVQSEEFKGLVGSVPGGVFQKNHRVQSRPVAFDQLLPQRGQKSLVTGASDTSAGAFVMPDDLGLRVGLDAFQRPLTLRDLVTSGTTSTDTIEYVRVTSVTNNAAPVPEAISTAYPSDLNSPTPTEVTELGYKPESGLAVQRYSTNVKTIAHWMPITKRALADAAQIVTLIDNFLIYGLEEELEDQMIMGDGSGENLEGLANTSGIQTQPAVTDPADRPEGFGKLLALRRAKTLVRTVGRSVPNGYLINPSDLETLDEIATRQDQFYFGGPSGSNNTQPLWGLPVIESEAVPAGTAYVGDWRKAVLWDRQQASITTTDSHADWFIRNMVAILAEMRVAFAVLQPNAFVEIDLSDGS